MMFALKSKKIPDAIRQQALEMLRTGATMRAVTEPLGVSQPTLCRWYRQSPRRRKFTDPDMARLSTRAANQRALPQKHD